MKKEIILVINFGCMNKKELWLRLHNYHFNHLVQPNLWEHLQCTFTGADASTKAFAHKLARKLGWSNAFALRAIAEYKKFVYLGVISDFVVTPSQVIDQVWHQHLLFNKAYRIFCSDVIEYDFDHNPELIPMDDQTGIFNAQYNDTLALYKKEFGYDAPAGIWGQTKFDEQAVKPANYQSKKKNAMMIGGDGGSSDTSYHDSTPLCESFSGSETAAEFGGFEGGDFGGGGAGGSWDSDGSNDSSGDSGSSDSSGGDSGSSCSSCSSGCGGGGD